MSDAEPEPTINNLSQNIDQFSDDEDDDFEEPLDKSVLPDRDGESDLDEDAQSIIGQQSFRNKYKLHQNHKLELPYHMRHLYNLFHQVDIFL